MPTLVTRQHVPAPTRPEVVQIRGRRTVRILGISIILIAVVVLTLITRPTPNQVQATTRADAAATARLEGLAEHVEAEQRQARANAASAARLEGLGEQVEAQRQARANAASTARLQGLAGQDD